MESPIANWWGGIPTSHALWNLVIDVQVLSAPCFTFTMCATSVLCENTVTIVVACKLTISKHELAQKPILFLTLFVAMACHPVRRVQRSSFNVRPVAIMVNVRTNLFASFVILFARRADAIF